MLRSPLVSDSVRVLLLLLADHMTERGYVSVPRLRLAEHLGKSPRRVQERMELAVRAGLLDRVRAGSPGVTAEYVATIPPRSGERVRPPSSRPLARLTDGADVRPTTGERITAPIGERSSAPSPLAHKGADDRPANYAPSAGLPAADENTSSLCSSAPAERLREPRPAQAEPQAQPREEGDELAGDYAALNADDPPPAWLADALTAPVRTREPEDLDALAEQLDALCAGCGQRMTVVARGQRTHPTCDPEHGWAVYA